jgi:uncharacterized protein YukE
MAQTFDPVTTQNMRTAYDDAQALYTNAITTVDHLTDDSKIYWTGAAGDTYRGELAGWSAGVRTVKGGLDKLQEAMNYWKQRSVQTEGDNITTGTGWHSGH